MASMRPEPVIEAAFAPARNQTFNQTARIGVTAVGCRRYT